MRRHSGRKPESTSRREYRIVGQRKKNDKRKRQISKQKSAWISGPCARNDDQNRIHPDIGQARGLSLPANPPTPLSGSNASEERRPVSAPPQAIDGGSEISFIGLQTRRSALRTVLTLIQGGVGGVLLQSKGASLLSPKKASLNILQPQYRKRLLDIRDLEIGWAGNLRHGRAFSVDPGARHAHALRPRYVGVERIAHEEHLTWRNAQFFGHLEERATPQAS